MTVIEDQGMIKAVLAGEREMYRRLVEKYQGLVSRVIARIIGSRPEVEDLAQETFWQAYRSLERFRGESCFSTWLLRIAANKAIDFLRRRREDNLRLEECERQIRQIPSSDEAPERVLLAKEQNERLYCYLDRLPAHYCQVLRRHYLEGFSYREIANEAGVPLKTVESRIYRARKLLRSLLNESGEYERLLICRA